MRKSFPAVSFSQIHKEAKNWLENPILKCLMATQNMKGFESHFFPQVCLGKKVSNTARQNYAKRFLAFTHKIGWLKKMRVFSIVKKIA